MATTDNNIDALLELDHFVRQMGVASKPSEVVSVVRAYLANWSKERIVRVQRNDAGWTPFDEYLRPFPVLNVDDVRRIRSSLRIRCRELEASGLAIATELVELDLFFFFANESLVAHEPPYTRVLAPVAPHWATMGAFANP